jgi:hypothetical protein
MKLLNFFIQLFKKPKQCPIEAQLGISYKFGLSIAGHHTEQFPNFMNYYSGRKVETLCLSNAAEIDKHASAIILPTSKQT